MMTIPIKAAEMGSSPGTVHKVDPPACAPLERSD
jgi:hypothetical protein